MAYTVPKLENQYVIVADTTKQLTHQRFLFLRFKLKASSGAHVTLYLAATRIFYKRTQQRLNTDCSTTFLAESLAENQHRLHVKNSFYIRTDCDRPLVYPISSQVEQRLVEGTVTTRTRLDA